MFRSASAGGTRDLFASPSLAKRVEGAKVRKHRGGGGTGTRRELQIKLARDMRKEPTETEDLLWQKLRRKQLKGFVFRRQYSVPATRFITDFCCPALKLIVEIDGKYHDDLEQAARDVVREELIRDFGYQFVRVTADDVAGRLPIVVEKIQSVVCRSHVVQEASDKLYCFARVTL